MDDPRFQAPETDDDRLAQRLEELHRQVVTESATASASGIGDEALASAADVFGLIERVRKAGADDTAKVRAHDTTVHDTGSPPTTSSTTLEFTDLAQGRRLGRFNIERKLGEGGYGFVFLAVDEELDRQVALKVPRPEAIVTDEMRSRFLREGKAAALLSHPHIVPVFETGRSGPVCYIVSQYVDGNTLADWMAQRGSPCGPRTAASLIGQLADAVQHAHHKGVIHRDLKPANVLLAGVADHAIDTETALADAARITDFRIGRIHDELGENDLALAEYTRALGWLAENPNRDATAERIRHARVLRSLAGVEANLGKTSEALDRLDAAIGLVADEATEETKTELAEALNKKGILLKELGRDAEAEEALRPAVASWKSLVQARPQDEAAVFALAQAEGNLGLALMQVGNTQPTVRLNWSFEL